MRRLRCLALACGALLCGPAAAPSRSQTAKVTEFAPIELWRQAVLAGDAEALTQMYSTTPATRITTEGEKASRVPEEVNFWAGWKAKGLKDVRLEIVQDQLPQPNVHILLEQVTLVEKGVGGEKKSYVAMAQGWMQQEDVWRIIYVQRLAAARLRQPMVQKDLYPASANANTEIAESLKIAASGHKRVMLVFGANWCYDCHVLDVAFKSPEISPTLVKSFEVVHVDIGQIDKNLDVAKRYDVPLDRGVPAIAVLESDGKLLFSQKRGEFEGARSMAPEDILEFLNRWKPAGNQ